MEKPSRTSTERTTLRLVLLSDTHQLHREVEVPDGDIFIHAGDFTMFSQSVEAVWRSGLFPAATDSTRL